DLPNARYIELEMAGGVEYQDRVWIGECSGSHRVLLGYHSGHFSLPALRVGETMWLASQTAFGPSNLLWLTTAYLATEESPTTLVCEVASHLPGVAPRNANAISKALHRNATVKDLRWKRDPARGWINNWSYSQRNPQSQMSILTPQDFVYIQEFFRDV